MSLTVPPVSIADSRPSQGAADGEAVRAGHPAGTDTGWRGEKVANFAMRWRDGLWLLLVVCTPLLAYAANLGFAPLAALVGLLAMPVILPERKLSLGFAALASLLVWALTSQLWGYYHLEHFDARKPKQVQSLTGLKLIFQFGFYGALVVAMHGVRRQAAKLGLSILTIGLCGLVVLLMVELVSHEQLYMGLKRALHQTARPDLAHRNVARAYYALALLVWPVALFAWRQPGHWRGLAVALGLGSFFGAIAFRVDAPVVAMVLGAVACAAVLTLGRIGTMGAMSLTILYFVLTPLVAGAANVERLFNAASGAVKPSWAARLDIWRFVSQMTEKRPFFGWGLDASRAFPGVVPLHPHDAALQIWLELGAVGVSLAVAVFAWLFWSLETLRRRDAPLAAAGTGAAVAYLVIGALSFGVWQEWWLALAALTTVVLGVVEITRRGRPGPSLPAFDPALDDEPADGH